MSSISDKLKELGVQVGSNDLQKPKLSLNQRLEQFFQGNLWETAHGDAYTVETIYPGSFKQGTRTLSWAAPLDLLEIWAQEPGISNLPPQAFAFLDTETTGLSGGTGTFAFMIGAGRFEEDKFRLVQFFLREPGEEAAQLKALEDFLAPCQILVTFNGKSFDVPILNNRFTLYGWPTPLNEPAHLDLLHLARRLWRYRLPSRRLGDLEVDILRTSRTEDEVPGWMVPEIYHEYLRTGDPEPLKGVFYHNAMDVLSMTALLHQIVRMLSDPMEAVEHDLDLFAIGKLQEDLGHLSEAVQLYEACLDRAQDVKTRCGVIERLSFIHKRNSKIAKAMSLWREAASLGEIYAHVELAKIYEHQQKDFPEALEWTQTALDMIDSPSFPIFDRYKWKDALDHRKQRLEKKIKKQEFPTKNQ